MTKIDYKPELRLVERYLSELEIAHSKLAVENAQLRTSHSYRLGRAFVQFFKRPRLAAVPTLLRDIRNATKPLTALVPTPPKRPFKSLLVGRYSHEDSFQKALAELPVGSAIEARIFVSTAGSVVGLIGKEMQARLGGRVVRSSLAYDRYDSEWAKLAPTYLVVDVGCLSGFFGWENAFTLRDANATVEMIAMLQKARQAGIRTVLIEPSEPHRYPLLSRARPLFDLALAANQVSLEALGIPEQL